MSYVRGNKIEPRLIRADDQRLQKRAGELIAVVARHQGNRRLELDAALEESVGTDPQYRLLRGWSKLLLDRCEFAVASVVPPEQLREALFRAAREFHPVRDEETRQRLLAQVAEQVHCRAEDIPAGLYADLAQNQQLVSFEELTARELLERYNVAQAQALLYRCQQITITLEPQGAEGYRRLFSAIKAYRLIHTIQGNAADGYTVTLDGPVSLFHRSQKYGIQMAVFLPALLLCTGWQMRAEIEGAAGLVFYELTSKQTQLRSHYVKNVSEGRPEIEKVLADWARQSRAGTLTQCEEVMSGGGSAWVPDLVARVPGQAPVYVELLGFWTPLLLRRRLEQIAQTGTARFVLTASEELRCSREELTPVPPQVVLYKMALDIRQLEKALITAGGR